MTRDAGFTLVEVMVALSVFALIGTMSTGLLVTTIDARERQEAAIERLSQLQQVRALWRDDAAHMLMRPHRTEDGGYGGAALSGRSVTFFSLDDEAGGHLAAFTRRGRANPGEAADRSSLVRVIWRVENGVLLRETWLSADMAPASRPQTMVLAEGLEDVSVSFRYGRNWLDAPVRPGSSGEVPMPDSIRLIYTDALGREIEHIALTVAAGGSS
ncbi:type II secretion system protein J [Glycocaulis alkaliphilus]|uniref:Type II secretion system protein J n=1 Tax=Glycocaulis alkaliphilus TaxID=1434191 RepID=A0A3T0E7W5_9PROT|nr:type II secretion system minor pseudopilin GspJ [Glycocaulis alkaliphilus]AZU03317.1 type II secretion system protein J [Glycocaulis alkaliphilus]GGB72692.1 type II secretion system protein GspJ [Glycocaulis alkaliphilus]